MHIFDDAQDALDAWDTDKTQWMITDGTLYGVGNEADALHALMTGGWEMTSPEEVTRAIRRSV